MSKTDRIRHKFRCLIGCITKHHSLITGSDCFNFIIRHFVFFCFQCFVNTHGNIGRLFIKSYHDCHALIIKAHLGIGITNLFNRISDNSRHIKLCFCCNLTGNQCKTGTACSFTGNTAHRILFHTCI